MALADADRAAVTAIWQIDQTAACGVNKADLRSAVNALDDYLDTNATSINNAIPQPARNALSTDQKLLILTLVLMRRYGKA